LAKHGVLHWLLECEAGGDQLPSSPWWHWGLLDEQWIGGDGRRGRRTQERIHFQHKYSWGVTLHLQNGKLFYKTVCHASLKGNGWIYVHN
jgi:hypothetical protein